MANLQQITAANFGAANSLAANALSSVVAADRTFSNTTTSLMQLKQQVEQQAISRLSKEIDQRNRLNQIELERKKAYLQLAEQAAQRVYNYDTQSKNRNMNASLRATQMGLNTLGQQVNQNNQFGGMAVNTLGQQVNQMNAFNRDRLNTIGQQVNQMNSFENMRQGTLRNQVNQMGNFTNMAVDTLGRQVDQRQSNANTGINANNHALDAGIKIGALQQEKELAKQRLDYSYAALQQQKDIADRNYERLMSVDAETKRLNDWKIAKDKADIQKTEIETKLKLLKGIAGLSGDGTDTSTSSGSTKGSKGMIKVLGQDGKVYLVPNYKQEADGSITKTVDDPRQKQLLATGDQNLVNDYIDSLDIPDTPVSKGFFSTSHFRHTNGPYHTASKQNLKSISPILAGIATDYKVPIQDLMAKMQSSNLAGITDTSIFGIDNSREALLPENLFSDDGRFKDSTAKNLAAYLYTGYIPKSLNNPTGRKSLATYMKSNLGTILKDNPTIEARYNMLLGE